MIYPVKRLSPNAISVNVDLNEHDRVAWFLLRSDTHHDNAHQDREMEKRHLELAKERGAGIIDNGDLFCAMQGKWDKRANQDELRPEHRGNEYLDLITEEAIDFYTPYAHNFLCLGHGNHETSLIKHHNIDITTRLAWGLKERTGASIPTLAYESWVFFRCRRARSCKTYILYRHHGAGGTSPVTKGVISTNRKAVYLPDADFIITGHDHNEWVMPVPRRRINQRGTVYQDEQLHFRIPGYKKSARDGKGWEIERDFAPTNCGAIWLKLWRTGFTFHTDYERAK